MPVSIEIASVPEGEAIINGFGENDRIVCTDGVGEGCGLTKGGATVTLVFIIFPPLLYKRINPPASKKRNKSKKIVFFILNRIGILVTADYSKLADK